LETTDTILAAAPDFTVPDLMASQEPPSIDAIEAASPEGFATTAPGSAESGPEKKKPEEPFSFGHDEIIQE
jgi:hypothetical protein